ncbi:Zinc-binding dehydrogenase [Ceratobasidium sp. AG-Ba]|nr:Zinc-binding dehydrogenase [Ceratobasidium sp. AG-Ba]
MTSVPETQKGWRVVRQGTPSKAVALQTFPVPKVKDGEVLVKIEAGALNPVGYKLMAFLPNLLARRPHVAEHDFTGTIVDPGSSTYKVGDAVFGFLPVPLQMKTGQGALAQYISIPTDLITLRPPSLVATQAAGIALAGVTAHQALFKILRIESGQHILIAGGSSSVGSYAIQIAKAHGCTVTSTCSASNIELVKGLGADEVIDYTIHTPHEYFASHPPTPKFHGILDCIGNTPQLFLRSPAYLAPNAKFASVGVDFSNLAGLPGALWAIVQTSLWPRWLGGVPRDHHTIMHTSDKKTDLDALAELINQGQLKPLVDSVYSFDDVLAAYDRILTHRAKGKVVVTID